MDLKVFTVNNDGSVTFGVDNITTVEGSDQLVQAVVIDFLSEYYKSDYDQAYRSESELELAIRNSVAKVQVNFSDQSDVVKLSEKLESVEFVEVQFIGGEYYVSLQVVSKTGAGETVSVGL